MGVYQELLAAEVLGITLQLMEKTIPEAKRAAQHRSVVILDQIQAVLWETETTDFEKIDQIVTIFAENKINSGSCHDFG